MKYDIKETHGKFYFTTPTLGKVLFSSKYEAITKISKAIDSNQLTLESALELFDAVLGKRTCPNLNEHTLDAEEAVLKEIDYLKTIIAQRAVINARITLHDKTVVLFFVEQKKHYMFLSKEFYTSPFKEQTGGRQVLDELYLTEKKINEDDYQRLGQLIDLVIPKYLLLENKYS